MTQAGSALYEDIFKAHERFLWGLCYRLTGNAADADDIVQETFIRAMKSPPARTDEPWRPWLVRVAMNLGRDLLRQRKRRGYEGQWLPSPIETGDDYVPPSYEPMSDEEGNPAARYDLMESVSFAFLLALEALTPAQRAVLLLRDVFDYSVQETAEALGMSEANVKTTHHRARRAMKDYDHQRQPRTRTLQERTLHAMQKFLHHLYNHDVAGAAAMLADDVHHVSDGGGEFIAARVPVIGRDKVMLFLTHIAQRRESVVPVIEWREMNGAPALVVEQPNVGKGFANRWVTICELNEHGQIKTIHNVLATRKLSRVRPIAQSKPLMP
ncbi:MAG TPA: sigma-70 family RNA polymerase sigma factor [Blastocatellia bacterium]|nr:sigma-70 family RNA polymerase sigma factor [Blastocatellia bacterium]